MANQTQTAAFAADGTAKAAKKTATKPTPNSSAKMAPKKVSSKKAATKKTSPVKADDLEPVVKKANLAELVISASKKRKATSAEDAEDEAEEASAPAAKKAKVTAASKKVKVAAVEKEVKVTAAGKKVKVTTAAKKADPTSASKKPEIKQVSKKSKVGSAINKIPTERLDVYVFGEGTSGELGLGSVRIDNKKPIDVKRPRLNRNLLAETVGVVQIAVGGMHAAALTADNKILTWGVNDQGALGRDTRWAGNLKDIDDKKSDTSSDDDNDDDDTGMNPLESTPTAIDSKHFDEDVKFVQVAASDSATFALTEDGSVYGWGTFRCNDGILGFTEKIPIQFTPIQLPELKKITTIATGSNHVLALDHSGSVFAWGAGQQNQLGRRVVERTRLAGLVPREFGLPKNKIKYISCGDYHSFAMTKDGTVYAWGLNSFGETGIIEGAGEDCAVVHRPTIVTSLQDFDIKEIQGGGHHSLACTMDGQLLVWGRADGCQMGVKISDIPKERFVYDIRGIPRILQTPTVVPGIKAVTVAAGSDNSFAIDVDGRAYSWGFSANYQTGQGTDDDIDVATLIENSAVKGKSLTGAGAGGQFSILWGPHQ